MTAKRWGLGGLTSIGALLVAASSAWACVSGPVVNLSTLQAQPGEEVMVNGTGFRQALPVELRFNALDGPLLTTLAKPGSDRAVEGSFTVPATAAPGSYVIIGIQKSEDGELALAPIRSLLTVVGPSGQAPVLGANLTSNDVERTAGLVRADSSVSTGTLALVALGVAGTGMFIAGIAALFASRREEMGTPAVARR